MGTCLEYLLFSVKEIFQTKVVQKNETHILCSINSFFFENRAVYEIMWKNTVGSDRLHMTVSPVTCHYDPVYRCSFSASRSRNVFWTLSRVLLYIWSMRFACWIITATVTHSEYVILTVLSCQKWLRERTSILSYTYIACLVYVKLSGTELNNHWNLKC